MHGDSVQPDVSHAYRADIDGLRAISVALVILFHLDVPGFGGGFVGVDVFFVISGFLITGLIFDGLERESFSFVRFYERRARRILPMLIIVAATSAAAGWFLLSPGDYEAFGGSAIAAVLAWSNFYFLHNTGYFDIPAQLMPLLHTWSLGVEEQFYLVWPVTLLLSERWLADGELFGSQF
jgi:peptidoglycan/LPS O-acetylase OafA/YrhL